MCSAKMAPSAMIAQHVALVAGLLVVADAQASDLADSSDVFRVTLRNSEKFITPNLDQAEHGSHVLSSYRSSPTGSDASQSSTSLYDKFIFPKFNHIPHGNGPDALSYHTNPAEHDSPKIVD